jgi:hypothetical protein
MIPKEPDFEAAMLKVLYLPLRDWKAVLRQFAMKVKVLLLI